MLAINGEFELLERHVMIVKVVRENQPIGLIRLSEITGIPKHKVRYSLKLLEQDGIIIPTQGGATVSDSYDEYIESLKKYIDGLYERIEKLRSVF